MAVNANNEVLGLTAQIVSAHIGKNQVSADMLPQLIQSVYRSLAEAGTAEEAPQELTPAVPIRKSVFPDYIICLEDGKELKILRRYLQTSYGMTPEQYRKRWGLPADYPMVAPSDASNRSALAKQIGLGRNAGGTKAPNAKDNAVEPDRPVEPSVTHGRARRARGSKG